jgi:hypothetical protein
MLAMSPMRVQHWLKWAGDPSAVYFQDGTRYLCIPNFSKLTIRRHCLFAADDPPISCITTRRSYQWKVPILSAFKLGERASKKVYYIEHHIENRGKWQGQRKQLIKILSLQQQLDRWDREKLQSITTTIPSELKGIQESFQRKDSAGTERAPWMCLPEIPVLTLADTLEVLCSRHSVSKSSGRFIKTLFDSVEQIEYDDTLTTPDSASTVIYIYKSWSNQLVTS